MCNICFRSDDAAVPDDVTRLGGGGFQPDPGQPVLRADLVRHPVHRRRILHSHSGQGLIRGGLKIGVKNVYHK